MYEDFHGSEFDSPFDIDQVPDDYHFEIDERIADYSVDE